MTDSSRLLRATACFLAVAAAAAWPGSDAATAGSPYAAVDARNEGTRFDNLPGHTRSAYASDHALITPESRVYTGLFGWKDTLAAWFITPAMAGKPNFSMYQVRRGDGAIARDRRRPPTRRASSSGDTPRRRLRLDSTRRPLDAPRSPDFVPLFLPTRAPRRS